MVALLHLGLFAIVRCSARGWGGSEERRGEVKSGFPHADAIEEFVRALMNSCMRACVRRQEAVRFGWLASYTSGRPAGIAGHTPRFSSRQATHLVSLHGRPLVSLRQATCLSAAGHLSLFGRPLVSLQQATFFSALGQSACSNGVSGLARSRGSKGPAHVTVLAHTRSRGELAVNPSSSSLDHFLESPLLRGHALLLLLRLRWTRGRHSRRYEVGPLRPLKKEPPLTRPRSDPRSANILTSPIALQ